ncbi:M48 family metalloprotease [Stigmatella sp. ncwal1]|uniref:M48 family metalloprotease n=1 Tax=Stigmatella ashevillensis TaxID=2995309 RepID=A0ABT5DJM3_9BACT|nr:M48 family metalloprotease [Stigmatella ashevillena]MDC0712561.1 M48 family metalloprotease [Stigmatella ashevillena]
MSSVSKAPGDIVRAAGKTANTIIDNPECEKLKADIPIQEEYSLGGAVALTWVRRGGGLMLANADEKQLHQYINTVGRNLAAQSPRPTLQWTFGVLLDPEAFDAVSAPGGYVFLTRGLLQGVDNEAQLAGVLAHEIAHITLKHALTRYGDTKATQCKVNALKLRLDSLTDKVVDSIVANGFGKEDEFSADELAVHLLVSAGYEPQEYIDFLGKIPDSRRGFANHPRKADRVKRLVTLLEESQKPSENFTDLPAGTQGLVKPPLPPTFAVVKTRVPPRAK